MNNRMIVSRRRWLGSLVLAAGAGSLGVVAASRSLGGGATRIPLGVCGAEMPAGVPADRLVTLDQYATFGTLKVGRASRPACVESGPRRFVTPIDVPAGGGQLMTAFAGVGGNVRYDVEIDPPLPGISAHGTTHEWHVVRLDLSRYAGRRVSVTAKLTPEAAAAGVWSRAIVTPNTPDLTPPDVFVITLDTTRPDYLSPYDQSLTTTPALAALAREGIRFDQAISPSSWTLPAHGALMTGHYMPEVFGLTTRLEPEDATLAEVFSAAGYRTFGVSGGPFTDSSYGFQQGFDQYVDAAEWTNASDASARAIEWLRNVGAAPAFVFINYFDAHEPYDIPPEFGARYHLAEGVSGPLFNEVAIGARPLTPQLKGRLVNAYRARVADVDRNLGVLFDGIRRTRNWDNTVIVVLADHGQLLGEYGGQIGHALTLEEELIRVPLIVKPAVSSRIKPQAYAEQVQTTDVFPIVEQLAGLAESRGDLLGRIMKNEPIRRLTFALVHHNDAPENRQLKRWRSATIAGVRTDTLKIERDAEGRVTILRLDRRMGETKMAAAPSAAALLTELSTFSANLPGMTGRAPMVLSPEQIERLRSLGYVR